MWLVFRHHFKLQFRIRRRAADRNGAKLGSYVASPPIPDTHINTFPLHYLVMTTQFADSPQAPIRWPGLGAACLHCPGLVSSSRAETTDTMSSHPVNTGNTHSHSHGETFFLVQWWTVSFQPFTIIASYNSISCPRRVCLAALMSWWHRWHCVQVSWCLCREGTSGRGRCWVSTEAETIGSMPGEDGATIHYYPLSSTILAPPVRTTHNTSSKQYNNESYLFQSVLYFEV